MVRKLSPDESILALDVGDARIGLARAGSLAKLPQPLKAIRNDENALRNLKQTIQAENIGLLVIGLPRNMKGEETAQSRKIREFAKSLDELGIESQFADESLSSKRADKYMAQNKKAAADQDSLAACFILEEYFNTIGYVP